MRSPLTKWAGGKYNYLSQLSKDLPRHEHYIEPFCGSAALCFHLQPSHFILNDSNPDVMNVYSSIQQHAPWVYSNMVQLCINYNTTPHQSDFFYSIRDEFNNLSEYRKQYCARNICYPSVASLFMFLNQSCFNGLCRYNKLQQFNVPHNKKKQIHINECEQCTLCSKFLENGDLMCTSYENVLDFAHTSDLVYLDPPALSKEFDISSYVNLFNQFRLLDKRGVYVLLSFMYNQDLVRMYDKMYDIEYIQSRSSMNRKNGNEEGQYVIVRSWKKKMQRAVVIQF